MALIKALGIAGRIFANLVEGAVILAMFHIASRPFETIVISGLVLIYIAVRNSFTALTYSLSKKWDIDLARYIAIARAININSEIEREAEKENQADKQKQEPGMWIDVVFNVIFSLIAIGNLLYTVSQ